MSKNPSAIGDLAGIIGGPVSTSPVPKLAKVKSSPTPKPATIIPESTMQPRLLEEPDERSDRITAILPVSLLSQVETRVAALRRRKKVSVSGYIEAALRELLATGDRDIEALEKYRIKARRTVSRVR